MMMLVREIRILAVVCLTIALAVTTAKAQQKILWTGAVMPERINVYASASTSDRVSTTLKKGDVVDVVHNPLLTSPFQGEGREHNTRCD